MFTGTKSFLVCASIFLALATQTSAHAMPSVALGVKGTVKKSDVQRPSTATPCGNVAIAANLDTSTAVPAAADGTVTMNIQSFDKGADGSTVVAVEVDQTGEGNKFVAGKVTTNGNPNPATATESDKVVFSLPAGTKCSGGSGKNLCLVSVKTTAGFGACTVVSQGEAGTIAAKATAKETAKAASKTTIEAGAKAKTEAAAKTTAKATSNPAKATGQAEKKVTETKVVDKTVKVVDKTVEVVDKTTKVVDKTVTVVDKATKVVEATKTKASESKATAASKAKTAAKSNKSATANAASGKKQSNTGNKKPATTTQAAAAKKSATSSAKAAMKNRMVGEKFEARDFEEVEARDYEEFEARNNEARDNEFEARNFEDVEARDFEDELEARVDASVLQFAREE